MAKRRKNTRLAKTPGTHLRRCSRSARSMTSSARPRSDGGIVSPSAIAVFKLITSPNLIGCRTGGRRVWCRVGSFERRCRPLAIQVGEDREARSVAVTRERPRSATRHRMVIRPPMRQACSPLPSGLAQAVEHMRVVFSPHPWHALADIQVERARRDRQRLLQRLPCFLDPTGLP